MSRITNILAVLLVLDLLGAGGLWFGYTNMQDKKLEEVELKKEIARESERGSNLAQMKKTLLLAEKEHERLRKYLYETDEESQIKFISDIEQLGTSTSGVLVETRTFEFSPSKHKSFRGDFLLKGTWEEIYHFLRLIEEYPARIVIGRFDAKGEGRSWEGNLSLDMISLKMQ